MGVSLGSEGASTKGSSSISPHASSTSSFASRTVLKNWSVGVRTKGGAALVPAPTAWRCRSEADAEGREASRGTATGEARPSADCVLDAGGGLVSMVPLAVPSLLVKDEMAQPAQEGSF